MTNQHQTIDETNRPSAHVPDPAARGPRLGQRGMVTIEYAIGVVLVLALVGVIIASIHQGWFGTLVQDLVRLLFSEFQKVLGTGW